MFRLCALCLGIVGLAVATTAGASSSRVVLKLPKPEQWSTVEPATPQPAEEETAKAAAPAQDAPAPHLSRYARATPPPPIAPSVKSSLARPNAVHRPMSPDAALNITTARPGRGRPITVASAQTRRVAAQASAAQRRVAIAPPQPKPATPAAARSATTSAAPTLAGLFRQQPPAGAYLRVVRDGERRPISIALMSPEGRVLEPSADCRFAMAQAIKQERTPTYLPPLCGVVDYRDAR